MKHSVELRLVGHLVLLTFVVSSFDNNKWKSVHVAAFIVAIFSILFSILFNCILGYMMLWMFLQIVKLIEADQPYFKFINN